MEDAMEDDPVLDIDGSDRENPLAVVEYIDDIYNFYKKTEVVSLKTDLFHYEIVQFFVHTSYNVFQIHVFIV